MKEQTDRNHLAVARIRSLIRPPGKGVWLNRSQDSLLKLEFMRKCRGERRKVRRPTKV